MAKKKKFQFPQTFYIYVYDWEDGEPQFGIVENVEGIPDECTGNPVGVYSFESGHLFEVKKTLAQF